MALIECTECKKEVSDKATSCPGCGHPLNNVQNTENKLTQAGARKCLVCNYEGPMKTWLRNYNAPQFIFLILLLFWLVPGLIFLAWGWGKHKCPNCGTLGKSTLIS